MNMINDGGPAFPSVGEGFGNPNYSTPGMTLRDYFAAAALQGLLAAFNDCPDAGPFASMSYAMADAMLRAREASND